MPNKICKLCANKITTMSYMEVDFSAVVPNGTMYYLHRICGNKVLHDLALRKGTLKARCAFRME